MGERETFQFSMPVQVRFGAGEIGSLARHVEALGIKRPLLVTDGVLGATPSLRAAVEACVQAGVSVEVWAGVVPNPTDTSVYEGLACYDAAGCDGLIGFGGGSAIDTAKAIGVLAGDDGLPLDAYFHPDPAPVAPLPLLIAIPTTAGTGSEVTWVSIISDDATGVKSVIRDRALFPTLSIVDPELTHSMPPALTMHTGCDALSHAIETYTSRQNAPLSEPLALRAVELIARALPRAMEDGSDADARHDMSLAATMAGTAFTNSMLHTGHHISHVLTRRYHLPHGLACIVTIPAMLAYLRPVREERISRLAPLFSGAATEAPGFAGLSQEERAMQAIHRLRDLMARIGVPAIEEATGEGPEAIPGLVAEIVAHGANAFSPRAMDAEAYRWILERTFHTGASLSDAAPE